MSNETTASQPTPHQNTLDAITGAIAYGRQGTNPPPSPEHWLAEYWSIGQQLAELGKTSAWDNVTPTASQPKSIGDDAQFLTRLSRFYDSKAMPTAQLELISYIDSRAPAAQASATIQAAPDWKLGTWFEARTLDEMEAFYMSRLPMIRAAAKEHGYAIGLHGTARRDFDLMAMQWRADASDKDSLARAIADAACGIRREGSYDWEKKPMGRVATSIPVCWTDHSNPDFDKPSVGHIDLSIIELAATIQEPVMAAEPVENCPICEEGTLVACNFHWCNKCGVEVGTTADANRNVEIMKLAAPMVADPAGVASITGNDAFMAALDGYMDAVDNTPRNSDRRISQRLAIFAAADAWKSAATVKAVPSEALSWVVEKGDVSAPLYRTIECGMYEWTPDHMKAIRFARRDDAEMFAAEDSEPIRICQHAWPIAAPLVDKTGGGE